MVVKKKEFKKKPSAKQIEKLKSEDEGYMLAKAKAIDFLEGRKQAVFNIARRYHLDREELFQEAYEVLLTCLRDFNPIYKKGEGKFITVMFTTFFGNRMETRGMELRNRDPEYQARRAYTESMGETERANFRKDPPLLVRHLDHDHAMQESLVNEVYEARAGEKESLALKIIRDSFFEKTLNKLVAKEKDEKKRAALLHVKVGGVYSFQEIAYHFGVSDSRASQVMNELMDAFYVQRMIDGSIESVQRDFKKLKFNDKRIRRLITSAIENASRERITVLCDVFANKFKGLKKECDNLLKKQERLAQKQPTEKTKKAVEPIAPPVYEDVFSDKENKLYPLVSVEMRPIDSLKFIDMEFRRPEAQEDFLSFVESFNVDSPHYPALVTEEGYILDGERRVRAAKHKGRDKYLCITRRVTDATECKKLRIIINHRLHKPDRTDIYYAVGALSDAGLSQQKIADCLNTSRTNVLVYAKVRDKASLKLRALFEDGLIQITNASNCVDFEESAQDDIATFIRRYGPRWSKGAKFNELYTATAKGKISKLEAKIAPDSRIMMELSSSTGNIDTSSKVVQALQGRINAYEQAMKDQEIWASQREGVITSQTQGLEAAREEIDGLKKELEAAELMRYGSPEIIEAELKELKKFYSITERLSGVSHGLSFATRDIKCLELRRKQVLEINLLIDKVEQRINSLRLEMLNRGTKREVVE